MPWRRFNFSSVLISLNLPLRALPYHTSTPVHPPYIYPTHPPTPAPPLQPLDKLERVELRKEAAKFVEPGFKLVMQEKVHPRVQALVAPWLGRSRRARGLTKEGRGSCAHSLALPCLRPCCLTACF